MTTGTTFASRASSRASSREGAKPCPGSAATAIERVQRNGQGKTPRGQKHVEVIEDVGGLLGNAFVGLARRRTRNLVSFLAHLRADALGVGQELGGVGALGPVGR